MSTARECAHTSWVEEKVKKRRKGRKEEERRCVEDDLGQAGDKDKSGGCGIA